MTPRPLAPALALCLAVLSALCTAQAAPAQETTTATAPPHAAAPAEPAASEGDFIRETRVYFPEALDRFYLEESKTLENAAAGVSLRYGYDGATFSVDVFVYPIGRMPEAQALDRAANELQLSFKQAEALGYYRDVDLSRPRTVKIPLNPLVTLPGRQITYTALIKDKPVVSHSLLTYRSYFMFKVRITAPKNEKRRATEVEREVIARLLPALRLSHVGSCVEHNSITLTRTDSLPPKGQRVSPDGSEVLVRKKHDDGRALAEAVARKADSACSETFDEEDIQKGEKFETLKFPAGAWKDSRKDASPWSGAVKP